MIVYHFSWNLAWFGFVSWPVAEGQTWRLFAVAIAASFLFLSGVSLELAHAKQIRWRAFWQRFAMIACAALLVTIATYFAVGTSFVRFGILHCLALSSLLALPFLRAPIWITASIAVLFLTLPNWATLYTGESSYWFWTGVFEPNFASVDYVPVLPWAGVTLMGVVFSKIVRLFGFWRKGQPETSKAKTLKACALLGRHSLKIYLLHQPLLFGLVWALAAVSPGTDRASAAFQESCTRACKENSANSEICSSACSCTLQSLQENEIWDGLQVNPTDPNLRARMNQTYAICLADPNLIKQK